MIDNNLDVTEDRQARKGSALLAADNIPDGNQSLTCFSCHAEMMGLYCLSCGQKNDNFRRSLFGLGWEAFTSLFAFENRIWRTWFFLFTRPGKVAREYCDGRRTHWTSPVRIYIFMSIVLFGFLSLSGRQFISIEAELVKIESAAQTQSEIAPAYNFNTGVNFFEREKDIKSRAATLDETILREKINSFLGGGFDLDISEDGTVVTTDDPQQSLPDDTFTVTDGTGQTLSINQDAVSERIVQLIKNPARVNAALNKWLPRIIFFMIPFSMLIGAIFIRGKNALLYDHIVHAAYIHGVTFFLLLIGIILSGFIPGKILAQVIFIGLMIYLPLSLKSMFGRGWFKTIFASFSVAFLYLLLITSLVTAVVAESVLADLPSTPI